MTAHPRSARPLRATLSTAIDQSGLGLHSGRPCRARISPAPPGHGVCFNGVPATIEHVVDGHFATTLQGPSANGSRSVRMIEHLLAALALAGIDDADIAVEGGEVPILDGSAAPWLALLVSQPHPGTERSCVTLTAPIHLVEGDASISAWPAETLDLTAEIDFPLLGHQVASGPVRPHARTFGFLRDAPRLHAAGLALGASPENTVIYDDAGLPLSALRFVDEPAHHKLLDLLGDLALLGAPLQARVHAVRAGHRLHHALVRAILQQAAGPAPAR